MNGSDAEPGPMLVVALTDQRESCRASDETPRQIFHDDVLVAVANEQHCELKEHLSEKPSGPAVSKVSTTKVRISQHQMRTRLFDGAVQVDQPLTFATEWKRWSDGDLKIRKPLTRRHAEMTVKVRRDNPHDVV